MLIFIGAALFFFLAIHSFTDKEIRIPGRIHNSGNRPCISAIAYGQTAPRLAQHHVRRIANAILFYCLALLELPPQLQRHLIVLCLPRKKLRLSREVYPISQAGDSMIQLNILNMEASYIKLISIAAKFMAFYRKGQLRRDLQQSLYNPVQPLWPMQYAASHGVPRCRS